MKTATALLDVNVLVALFDPDHVHHDAAHTWFATARSHGWATCPLTENGLVRVLSNPAYSPSPELPGGVLERLTVFRQSGGHAFWAADLWLGEPRLLAPGASLSHRNVTDVYLLALAVRRDARLATFDRGIPLAAVEGASPRHLVLVPA
jgi:toxin-antitoxin system PIN domain toxin